MIPRWPSECGIPFCADRCVASLALDDRRGGEESYMISAGAHSVALALWKQANLRGMIGLASKDLCQALGIEAEASILLRDAKGEPAFNAPR